MDQGLEQKEEGLSGPLLALCRSGGVGGRLTGPCDILRLVLWALQIPVFASPCAAGAEEHTDSDGARGLLGVHSLPLAELGQCAP